MLIGIDLAIVIVYFIVILGVGILVSKKAAGSIDDYFLGGRAIKEPFKYLTVLLN